MIPTDIFNHYLYNYLDEDILEEIPDNFGIELNFSGVKEQGVFTMGLHYHDSTNIDFHIEASGKNTKELIQNLDLNLQKLQDEKEHKYEDLEEEYYRLLDDYNALETEHNILLETIHSALGKLK